MIQVRCLLCLEKEQKRLEVLATQESWTNEKLLEKEGKAEGMMGYNIQSKIISKSPEEEFQLLGAELIAHLQTSHKEDLVKLMQLGQVANGFQVVKYFETEKNDSLFEKEKEKMRDMIIEETLKFAPEDEEEDSEFEDSEELEDDCDDDEESDDEFEDEDCPDSLEDEEIEDSEDEEDVD